MNNVCEDTTEETYKHVCLKFIFNKYSSNNYFLINNHFTFDSFDGLTLFNQILFRAFLWLYHKACLSFSRSASHFLLKSFLNYIYLLVSTNLIFTKINIFWLQVTILKSLHLLMDSHHDLLDMSSCKRKMKNTLIWLLIILLI